MYGSKINTVRDGPGGYLLTGRRDSEMPGNDQLARQKQREGFLVTGACGQVGSVSSHGLHIPCVYYAHSHAYAMRMP